MFLSSEIYLNILIIKGEGKKKLQHEYKKKLDIKKFMG